MYQEKNQVLFHHHCTVVDTMKKKWTKKIFVENLHAAYPYPLHYLSHGGSSLLVLHPLRVAVYRVAVDAGAGRAGAQGTQAKLHLAYQHAFKRQVNRCFV